MFFQEFLLTRLDPLRSSDTSNLLLDIVYLASFKMVLSVGTVNFGLQILSLIIKDLIHQLSSIYVGNNA